jgi:hypothetical protein
LKGNEMKNATKKLQDKVTAAENFCKKYGITNYTINHYGAIDVNGSVDLRKAAITSIPVQFGDVTGDFDCNAIGVGHKGPNGEMLFDEPGDFKSEICLTSLFNCPFLVGGDFDCAGNPLTSLEGGPKVVGGVYDCSYTSITSFDGAPHEVGSFDCYSTDIVDPKALEALMSNMKARMGFYAGGGRLGEILAQQNYNGQHETEPATKADNEAAILAIDAMLETIRKRRAEAKAEAEAI